MCLGLLIYVGTDHVYNFFNRVHTHLGHGLFRRTMHAVTIYNSIHIQLWDTKWKTCTFQRSVGRFFFSAFLMWLGNIFPRFNTWISMVLSMIEWHFRRLFGLDFSDTNFSSLTNENIWFLRRLHYYEFPLIKFAYVCL